MLLMLSLYIDVVDVVQLFVVDISRPRQVQSSSDEKWSRPSEILKCDLAKAKQRLDAEFQEKIAKKASPGTFPKPVVTPRRSSLQLTRDHFKGFQCPSSIDRTENLKSSRKSVGDIFGERISCRSSEPRPGSQNLLRLVREFSGDKSPAPPADQPLLRSATWVGSQRTSQEATQGASQGASQEACQEASQGACQEASQEASQSLAPVIYKIKSEVYEANVYL